MELNYTAERSFLKADFTETGFPAGEYENCVFDNCNFLQADLSGSRFTSCLFKNCNLSAAILKRTALADARFEQCNLQGLHFESCDHFLFSASFTGSNLRYSSFYQLKMKKTQFNDCDLRETDFTEADLSGSVFGNCDLALARFEHTGLEKTDFRTARNYVLDPELNRIRKAMFSSPGVTGLLGKYDIEID